MPVNRTLRPLAFVAAIAPATALAAPPTKEQCIAANEAVQYLREAHKLREAREKLLVCVSDACPGPVRDDCAQRLDEVSRATPSVVFEVKDSAGNDVPGVAITMDGQALAGTAGIAIEVDPGEHTFGFEANGSKGGRTLVVVEGVKQRQEVIRLGVAAPEATTPASGPSRAKLEGAPPRLGGGPPILSWAAFGVGGTGLLLGITAGLVAGGAHSTLLGECGSSTCPPSASGDLDSFHTWRTVSTVGYVVGALGVAGGAVLWLTAPKAQTSTARVWVGPSSAGVGGTF